MNPFSRVGLNIGLVAWLVLSVALAPGPGASIASASAYAFNTIEPEFATTQGLRERFYTETGDGPGTGYSVTDYLDGPRFLEAFERLGGPAGMGYPISRPFLGDDGLIYQLTQRAMLQWSPPSKLVAMANLYQIMQEAGLDDELLAEFIPRPVEDAASSYEEAKAERLLWLTDPAIRTAFLNNPLVPGDREASIQLYGLPMSRPVTFGPFVAQRFQRIAFQHWTKTVLGGQPLGSVVPVNGGDVLKRHLYAGTRVAAPHIAGDIEIVGLALTILPPFTGSEGLPKGYATTDEAILRGIKALEPLGGAADGLAAARALRTRIRFGDLPRQVLGMFSSDNIIRLSESLRNEDVRVLAVVLLHELVHLSDWRNGRLNDDYRSCLDAETRAIEAEATAWGSLVGPEGKRPALTQIERLENHRLSLLLEQGSAISDHANQLYNSICAA